MEGVLFREVQILRSTKFMWIILPALLASIVAVVYAVVQQLLY